MTAAIDDMVRAIDGTVGAMLAGAVRTGVDGHPNQQARRSLKSLDEALRARGTPVASDVLQAAARAAAGKRLANRLSGVVWSSSRLR